MNDKPEYDYRSEQTAQETEKKQETERLRREEIQPETIPYIPAESPSLQPHPEKEKED